MIVAGIGCRKGAHEAEVEAAIDAALDASRSGAGALSTLIATSDGKGGEAGIVAAAAARGLPLVLRGAEPSSKQRAAGRNPHPRA